MTKFIEVTEDQYTGRKPQTKWEEQASVIWLPKESIMGLEDWQAKLIVGKS